MKSTINVRSRIRGINLVELMVALALGSFLSIGVIQLYASHRVTTRSTEGVAEVQDNIRYALHNITKTARIAGYTGCISKDRGLGNTDGSDDVPITNLLNDNSELLYNFGQAIEGFDDITGALPTSLAAALIGEPAPVEKTDVIVLRGASGDSVPIVQNNNSAQFFAALTSTQASGCEGGGTEYSGLCEEDIVLASDCKKSVIFQISNLQPTGGGASLNIVHARNSMTPGNAIASWGGNSSSDMIGTDGEIIQMNTHIFYVAEEDGQKGLYRKRNNKEAELIAANVMDFQVTYGEDTDQDFEVDRYEAASSVGSWSNVVSVRLNLLAASDTENIVGEIDQSGTMSLPFNGETFVAPDRRLYKAVTTTVVLRNLVN